MLSWLFLTCYLLISGSKIKFLKKVNALCNEQKPSVAIIIAVRNEETELEKALETICNLDYSNYNIIIVNDRSTDKTPAILYAYSRKFEHLKVITVNELPAGWLGKSHALYLGYKHSKADYLLFTDADVSLKPDTLKKAIAYTVQRKLDHLVVLPHIKSRSEILNAVIATFKIMFDLQYKPWLVNDPNSEACLGIGAFNFVKRTAYEAAGTHLRIALHPNDDIQLGYCIKSSGFRQEVLYGDEQVQYEWYTSVREFINGLMKNAFSSVNYSFFNAFLSSTGALIFFVLPVPVLILSGQRYQVTMGIIIILSQFALYLLKPAMNAKWWYVLVIPYAALVIIFIMLKSAVVTLRQGGIYWSNSFYKLSELRKFNEGKYIQ